MRCDSSSISARSLSNWAALAGDEVSPCHSHCPDSLARARLWRAAQDLVIGPTRERVMTLRFCEPSVAFLPTNRPPKSERCVALSRPSEVTTVLWSQSFTSSEEAICWSGSSVVRDRSKFLGSVLAGESTASGELKRFPTRELSVADFFADPTTLLADADDMSSQ